MKRNNRRKPLFNMKPVRVQPLFNMGSGRTRRKPLFNITPINNKAIFNTKPAKKQPIFNMIKQTRNPRFPMLGDRDKDGVTNVIDCQPNNPFAQDWPGESQRHSEVQLKAEMKMNGWFFEKCESGPPDGIEIVKVAKREIKNERDFITVVKIEVSPIHLEPGCFQVMPRILQGPLFPNGIFSPFTSKIQEPEWIEFKDRASAFEYANELTHQYDMKIMVGGV